MAVYVDQPMASLMGPNWRWPMACHLFADSVEELHAFAQGIGMKRSWFQNNPRLPHYDLNENRRRVALEAGAQPTGDSSMISGQPAASPSNEIFSRKRGRQLLGKMADRRSPVRRCPRSIRNERRKKISNFGEKGFAFFAPPVYIAFFGVARRPAPPKKTETDP